MMRIPNWDVALRTWAERMIGLPYVWGDTDCVHLALGALHVMYPDTFAVAWPDRHLAFAAAHGDRTIIGRSLLAIGATPLPFGFASIGDLLNTDDSEEPALMVCLGLRTLSADLRRGVVSLPTAALPLGLRVWRFPHGE